MKRLSEQERTEETEGKEVREVLCCPQLSLLVDWIPQGKR